MTVDTTALEAAVAKLGSDATADHDDIVAAFTDAKIASDSAVAAAAALTAGDVLTQATIDSLVAATEAVDTAINDTAAAVVPVIVVPPTTLNWAPNTAFNAGDKAQTTRGIWQATVAGTTGPSSPDFAAAFDAGTDVVDGTVTWHLVP